MRDYTIHPKIRIRKRKSSRSLYLLVIFLFSLSLFSIYKTFLNKNAKTGVVDSESHKIEPTFNNNSKEDVVTNQNNLLVTLTKLLQNHAGGFAIYIYDIDENKGFGINEQTVLNAASVNKIPILATVYNLAGKDEIDLEKIIAIQGNDIQNYGTGVIRYEKPGTTYSIKTLSRLMMEKSDNTAAYVLANHVVGQKKIQSFVDSWGLTQTDIINNKTSVEDMSRIMIKMYQGEITTRALTAEMLGFMDNSDFEDRISNLLPTDIAVYHKTGDEIGKVHDVGIINLPQRPYYLGIMTFDVRDEVGIKQAMAQVSRTVFDYMSSL